MDIYPEDLEPSYRMHIQWKRAQTPQGCDASLVGTFVGFLPGMFSLGVIFGALAHTDFVMFFGGVAGSALGWACGAPLDRDSRRRRASQKVTAEEISAVGQTESDSLKREHLGLVFKLISMGTFQDTLVEQSIRSAIRDIGAGVARLPGQPADELLQNAQTFKTEASRLATEAAHESDAVVAASLQRQSAARSQRADAISRNSALARRNQVLRHEMAEHIQALNTMLDATVLEDSGDGYGLAALAANIQQVAIEARSLTEAKHELAFALEDGQGSRMSVAPEQTQLYKLSG